MQNNFVKLGRCFYGTFGGGPNVSVGPATKGLLLQYGLNIEQIAGSGPKGRILKSDVLKYVQDKNIKSVKQESSGVSGSSTAKKSQPVILVASSTSTSSPSPSPSHGQGQESKKIQPTKAPQNSYTDIEITSMRRTIATRLLQSKSSIPHAYATGTCYMKNILNLRKRMNQIGLKASLNDFIIKCTANALAKSPEVNVTWNGEKLLKKDSYDISIAVATPKGLITPIVTNVGSKDVLQISEDVRGLAEKARNGKLQPHEFIGGTFSISNLGMFGIYEFTAIINPPQCAILAVGGNHPTIGKDGNIEQLMSLTMSYDSRAISEADSVKFLAYLKNEIEQPSEISMGIFDLASRLEMIELFQ